MKLWLGRVAVGLLVVSPLCGSASAQSPDPAATPPTEATVTPADATSVPAGASAATADATTVSPEAPVAPKETPVASPFAPSAWDVPSVPSEAFSDAAAASDRPAGDGRRTMSAFPKNLGRGFVGVFSRDNLAPFLFGSSVALAGHGFDQRAARALDGACLSCGKTGATMGGAAVVPFVGALFAAGRFSPSGSTFRSASYDAAQALIVNSAWTGLLKYSLQRTRPDGSDALSLPSGHTSTAFALATVAERHYGWKAGLPAYALAAGIGLSRMESNKHYLSDVLAGATIGTIVGRTVTRVNGGSASRRTLAVTPATDPHGAGIGLGFSATW